MRRLSLAIAFMALSLAACTQGQYYSYVYRSGVHPFFVDPADIIARVNLPDGIKHASRSPVLEFNAARTDSQEVMAGWYPMVLRDGSYRLRAEDVVALRKLQRILRLWRSEAPDRALARMTILVKGCAVGNGPEAGATLRLELSGDGGKTFRTIRRGMTAEEALETQDGPPGVFGRPPC